MKPLRSRLWPALVAGVVFALPYAVPMGIAGASIAAMDGPPVGIGGFILNAVLVTAFCDLVLCGIPGVFYLIASYSWRDENQIVHEHLFGWPVGIAITSCFSWGVVAFVFSSPPLSYVITMSILMAAFGLAASWIWRRLSYPMSDKRLSIRFEVRRSCLRRNRPNQSPEPTPGSVTPRATVPKSE